MRVIARTDPHAAREEVRQAHPDWIAVTKDGSPYRHWANPDLWVTCALGPYNFDFMDRVQREIVSRYRVDGISRTGGRLTRACLIPNGSDSKATQQRSPWWLRRFGSARLAESTIAG